MACRMGILYGKHFTLIFSESKTNSFIAAFGLGSDSACVKLYARVNILLSRASMESA